jgi:hypothetical protein
MEKDTQLGALPPHATSGTEDDDDNPGDERDDENEAPVREVDDRTEAPEEFAVDDGLDADDTDDDDEWTDLEDNETDGPDR